jgi:hypothetical protein
MQALGAHCAGGTLTAQSPQLKIATPQRGGHHGPFFVSESRQSACRPWNLAGYGNTRAVLFLFLPSTCTAAGKSSASMLCDFNSSFAIALVRLEIHRNG